MDKDSQPPSDSALASVSGSLRCRKCGKTAHEIGGYLHRVNELGVKGVWECRPSCEAAMSPDDRLIAAIEGTENAGTQRSGG